MNTQNFGLNLLLFSTYVYIFFVSVFSSILKVATFRNGNVFLYFYLYVMILFCVVFTEREFHLHPFLSQLPY